MIRIDGYDVDVAVREEHTHECEVSKYPVEEGADRTDHVRVLPDVVVLEGCVSDTPIGSLADTRGIEGVKASEEAYDLLKRIRKARLPVTIETSLGRYESMVLKSLRVPRTPQDGDALVFTATFEEFIVEENERTIVSVSVPRARKKRSRGHKASQSKAIGTGEAQVNGGFRMPFNGEESVLNQTIF